MVHSESTEGDPVDLLVLGGSAFVGRSVAEEAVARGWAVAVFNRGTRPAPDGAVVLRGDRTDPSGLAAIERGQWDVVVDTWSWAPVAVRDAARLLAGRVGTYVYVSSRSVYEFPTVAGADETAPVVAASPDDDHADDYARAKAGGELAVLDAFGASALLLRAGLILGPHEDIGRLPWWLQRIDRGGPVLAPGPRDLALQYVDARDLARFALDAAARGVGGPYDVVSASGHATMGSLLDACVTATGSDADLRWADPQAILDAGAEPWTDLPIWCPPGELHDAIHRSDVSRALSNGLVCRDVDETVADTWAWLQARGGTAPHRPDRPAVGLDRDVETAILAGLVGDAST